MTPTPEQPSGHALRVRDLAYTYPSATDAAVRDLSFELRTGEILGFLGPSGAGKSTTQKVLMRLVRGHEGEVEALGRPLASWGRDYYEHIGVSFELPNHYLKLTALENLGFFASLYRGRTADPRDLLAAVGLADDADRRVGQFSKGMQQRLTLARSLLNDPALLFLDEPTAGLDPGNSRRVKDLVLELRAQGRSVFLTTHDMAVADELCDRVAFIVAGRLVALDTPTALRRRRPDRQVLVEVREPGPAPATGTPRGDTSAPGAGAADGSGPGRRTVERYPLAGLADDTAFHERLRRGGIEAIRTDEATLEDVFLELTGTSLAGDQPPLDDPAATRDADRSPTEADRRTPTRTGTR